MLVEEIFRGKAPLFWTSLDMDSLTSFAWGIEKELLVTTRFLRGRKMRRFESLYDEVAASLQFPYYFGQNYNALHECIRDLSWIPGKRLLIIISEMDQVVADEQAEEFCLFWELLADACQGFLQSADKLGKDAVSSQLVAMSVILQCQPLECPKALARLEQCKCAVDKFDL